MKFRLEEHNAKIAIRKIQEAGGFVTFDEYDRIMRAEIYFVPLHWNLGWGLPPSMKKANDDKMCVFEAIEQGWVSQEKNGYRVNN